MRHPSVVRSVSAVLLLAAALAVSGAAQAVQKKNSSVAEQGVGIMVPPSFIRGKVIPPENPAEVPILFVFVAPGSAEGRAAVKKAEAVLARKPPKGVRVILVVRGKDQADCRKNAAEFGAAHMEWLADPAAIMQAQFNLEIGPKNFFHLRSYSPQGKVAVEGDCEGFLKRVALPPAAKPAKDKADPPGKAGKPAPEAVPLVSHSDSPRLKDAYNALKAGEKSRALSKFRVVAGDKSGKDPALVAEAEAQVARLEQELDAVIADLKTHPADRYVADLADARAQLLPAWQEDGKSKNKVEAFIKEWEKKDQVKNEYVARRMRHRIWQAMAAPKPDRKQLGAAFQAIADKCPGTTTGIQAVALVKALAQ